MVASSGAHAANPTLFAAGSLRGAFTALIDRFAADTGIRFDPTYGPSGALRETIEKGQVPDVFASANLEHPQALAQQGILKNVATFATNHLCLLAAPGASIDKAHLLDTMLDPKLRLATSTPMIDPAGDYTWALFRKAEQQHPGAYAVLDRKANKLLGQPGSDGKSLGVLDVLERTKTDLVIAYCSYGELALKTVPGSTWAAFPPELDVPSEYGLGLSARSDRRAEQFQQFLLGPDGVAILRKYGFSQ